MPASPSRKTSAKSAPAPAGRRPWWPLLLLGVIVAGGVVLSALPASLLTRALPPTVQANDLSGTVWHGSAGKLTWQGRDVGALEWRLRPGALLHLVVELELHWVKGALALDATADLDRGGVIAHDVKGGGPLEDLHDIGALADVHGSVEVALTRIETDFTRLRALVGELRVSNIGIARVDGGADLGNYVLQFADGAVDANGAITGGLNDAGGPLEIRGSLQLSPQEHRGTITATLLERATMSPELRADVQNLAQLRGRDLQGRIPADLEFSF